MVPTVSRGPLPKLLGHTVTIEEAKALIEMEANKQSQPQQESSLFDQTYQKGKAMEYKKEEFDPNAPGIIAHSRVQVLNSANWGDGNVPVFSVGIRINLSVMAGEPPWLRIHLSPDPFRVVKRTEQIVRLQHEQIWVEIASQELDALFAKAGLGAANRPDEEK